jgi:hypothetical protein
MTKTLIVAWVLSLTGGIVITLLGSIFSGNGTLFLPAIISGLIIIFGAAMLYAKPSKSPLWSSLVIIVAIIDLFGVLLFFYAPVSQAQAITAIASVGPLIALIGGVAGLASKPLERGNPRIPA